MNQMQRKPFESTIISTGWLALFKSISQIISWFATIVVARILVPEDYGLMEMATVFTGYVVLFNELGLGSAIVQKGDVSECELSSLFWILLLWSLLLGIMAFILAYPTMYLFSEARLLRLTQSTSILFVLGALVIVPRNLLLRRLKFKQIGFIDAVSIILSCLGMIFMAKKGAGVWTLLGGYIVKEIARLVLYFLFSKWVPMFHFSFHEIQSYLGFGFNVALNGSLFYIYTKADRFFGGRTLGSTILGGYTLALQLSAIPTEKIVSIIKSVSYPFFCKHQQDNDVFNKYFLDITSLVSIITFPLFSGAFIISDELILVLLGNKWMHMAAVFKWLCLAQLIISITAVNELIFISKGKPQWNLVINVISAILMPVSFFYSVRYGLNYLVVPWLAVFPIIRLSHTIWILRSLAINLSSYILSFKHSFCATIVMISVTALLKYVHVNILENKYLATLYLPVLLLASALVYFICLYIWRKDTIHYYYRLCLKTLHKN